MKIKSIKKVAIILFAAVICVTMNFRTNMLFCDYENTVYGAEEENEAYETVQADEGIRENDLYSLSACLLDGTSGRVLYEKDGYTIRANASTTKIMTCILALEYGNQDDLVEISKYAAGMPDVQLNVKAGEKYRLGDLLYSLMLESHNDTAVAIAEHISGDVKSFAALMNEKAKELGCYDTYFITPNGLDATETVNGKEVFHGTTAADLCKIMAYCIKNEEFLKITRTSTYTFSNKVTDENGNVSQGTRSFSVSNKNAFLTMMDGALSGKTGFTVKAGYCYVGALERDGKVFIVALLGCGWPNNKGYKWSDTKALMNYGIDNYEIKDLFDYDIELKKVTVKNGKTESGKRNNISEDIVLDTYIDESPIEMLVKDGEQVKVVYKAQDKLTAPVCDRQVVGSVDYYLDGKIIKSYPVYVSGSVEKTDYIWFLKNTVKRFLMLE